MLSCAQQARPWQARPWRAAGCCSLRSHFLDSNPGSQSSTSPQPTLKTGTGAQHSFNAPDSTLHLELLEAPLRLPDLHHHLGYFPPSIAASEHPQTDVGGAARPPRDQASIQVSSVLPLSNRGHRRPRRPFDRFIKLQATFAAAAPLFELEPESSILSPHFLHPTRNSSNHWHCPPSDRAEWSSARHPSGVAMDVLRKVSGASARAVPASNAGTTTASGSSNNAPASTASTASASNSLLSASLARSPRSSISRDSVKDKDAASSRMAKMRAAMHIGSVYDDWPMYSANGDDYIVGDVIGFGASSVVHQGVFKPLDRACAIKVIDLEAYGRDTEELRRETQLMSLSKHPNVLRVRGCWVKGAKLHIATRLMSSGSMLDIMRFAHPEGFDELVIATVLKHALEGLNYLHINGWLHRDLKAANILVDDDGTVLLGDFGVGVFVGDTDKSSGSVSSEGKRKSFVGTPCWMAPEVIERKHYGTKADIWSFGITALELAQGRAPNSKLNPVKVLMRTMQDEPPQLDRTGGAHKYSKLMDDFVRQCLQKDPERRPTADKLLSHGFFKQAKAPKYLISAILAGLPPLADRQERRRLASIHSTQHYLSWDFGTINSRTTTPNFERIDPFRNFTGVVSLPSPQGSVRSTKLVSIDGHHVLATEEDDTSLMRRFSSYDDALAKEGAMHGSFGRRRGRSVDALGHRKSVSFEGQDSGGRAGAEVDSFGTAGIASSLAPIGEKVSPMVSPTQQPAAAEEPTSLRLSDEDTAADGEEASAAAPEQAGEKQEGGSTDMTLNGSSQGQRSVSSATTATLVASRSDDKDDTKAAAIATAPAPNMLQRTASRLRGSGSEAASGAHTKHHKRESVFGKLFKGTSSGRKEGKV